MKGKRLVGVLGLATALTVSSLPVYAQDKVEVEETVNLDAKTDEQAHSEVWRDLESFLKTQGYTGMFGLAKVTYFSPTGYKAKLPTNPDNLKSKSLRDMKVVDKTYKGVQKQALQIGLQFSDKADYSYMKVNGYDKELARLANNAMTVQVIKPNGDKVEVPFKVGTDAKNKVGYRVYINYKLNSVGTYKVQFLNSSGKIKNQFKFLTYKDGAPTLTVNKFAKVYQNKTNYMQITSASKDKGLKIKVTYKKVGAKKETVLADYSTKNTKVVHTFPKKGKYVYSTYVKYDNSPKARKYTKTITIK